jgi:hypothetical protein
MTRISSLNAGSAQGRLVVCNHTNWYGSADAQRSLAMLVSESDMYSFSTSWNLSIS